MLVHRLEGVRELEEEHSRFRQVLDLGSMGEGVAVPSGGEIGCGAVCKESLQKGDRFWAREMNEEGGSEFPAA
jgi:hypothetical protein